MAKLTPKQARFVDEYLVDLNATRAYKRAGYSVKSDAAAGVEGHKLLKNPKVSDAIAGAKAERSERTKIDSDWVLRRLADAAEARLSDLYSKGTGQLLPVHEWPDAWQLGLVAGIETNKIGGEDSPVEVVKVKIADRTRILELIGKHVDIQAFREAKSVTLGGGVAVSRKDATDEEIDRRIAELTEKLAD